MTPIISKHSSRKGLPERLYSGVTPWILIYYLATSVLILIPSTSFIKDIFITPLYFLLPTGFGLLFLYPLLGSTAGKSKLTTGQLLFCAFVIGTVLITMQFQLLEKFDLLRTSFVELFAFAKVASLLGFLLFRGSLVLGPGFRNIAFDFLVVSPIILFNYWIKYFVFADYPLRDIFQETHFMKGAMELSRFQILNPHTADSYIPIAQVFLGVLHHFYNYGLINSQWILPVFFSLLHFLVFYEVLSALGLQGIVRRVGVALCVIFLGVFTLTNGDLAQQLSLVVLAGLVGWKVEGSRLGGALGVAVIGASITLLPFYRSRQIGLDAITLITIFAVAAVGTMARRWVKAEWAILGILMATAPVIHRGSLLFVLTMLGAYVGYVLIRGGRSDEMMVYKAFGVAMVAILAFVFMMEGVAVNVLVFFGMIDINRYVGEFLVSLLGMILGMKFKQSDLTMGSGGGIVPPIEWIRANTPLLQFILGTLLLVFSVKLMSKVARKESLTELRGGQLSSELDLSLWGVVVWGVTAVVSLSGAPFIYRLKDFSVVMQVIIVSVICGYLYDEYVLERPNGNGRFFRFVLLIAISSGVYTWLSQERLYNFRWQAESVRNEYLRQLHPYTVSLLVVIGVLFGIAAVKSRDRIGVRAAICGALMSLMLDRVGMTTRWMIFSYEINVPQRPVVVSHYTKAELEVAQRLSREPVEKVLFSDPYTLSVMRAFSGLNSLYSFANISTVDEGIEPVLQEGLRLLEEGDSEPQVRRESLCRMLEDFVRRYPDYAPELRYLYERRLGKELGSAASDGNVLLIVTEKTMKWAETKPGRSVGYYPMNGKVERAVLEVVETPFVRVVENIDDRVLVFSLDCNGGSEKVMVSGY